MCEENKDPIPAFRGLVTWRADQTKAKTDKQQTDNSPNENRVQEGRCLEHSEQWFQNLFVH